MCDFGEAKIIKEINTDEIQKEFLAFERKQNEKKERKKKKRGSGDNDDDESDQEIEVEEMNNDDPDGMDFENENDFDFGRGDEDEDEDADPFADIFEDDVRNHQDNDDEEKRMPGMAHRGTFVGTPLYASPEMLSNSVSGPFTDLWALGVIVY